MLAHQSCLLAFGALILLAVSAAAQPVSAPPPATTTTPPYSIPYSFPPVGLAYTETLQINVISQSAVPTAAYLAGNFSAISPNSGTSTTTTTLVTTATPPIAPPTACTGTISFNDATGKTIGSPVPFRIATSGQVFSAPLPFSMTGFTGFRGIVVPSVQQTVPASTGSCSLAISLETFDTNTGVTHAVLTAAAQPFTLLSGILQAIQANQ